jgi:hypothetical protein
MAIDVLS